MIVSYVRIAVSSARVLRCAPRLICLSVNIANQRSTRFQPLGAGRREVHMDARVHGEPAADLGRLVRAVVVEDEMNVEAV